MAPYDQLFWRRWCSEHLTSKAPAALRGEKMDAKGITAKRVAPPVPVTPPATISLEGLTTKQARQLLAICKTNIDVPRATVGYHDGRGINVGTTDDLNDLLHALSDALERAGVHI